MGQNLPIYGVKCKGLKDFTTSEKDLKKGINRVPLEMSRIREEDIIKTVDQTSAGDSTLNIVQEFEFK